MVKIFISGTEGFTNYIRKYKVNKLTKYALITFYSLHNSPDPVEFVVFLKQHVNELMVDSGAFTYMNSLKASRVEKEYIEKYIKFYHRTKHLVDYYISIDVGPVETQKKYHKILLDNGVDAIPVYHLFDNNLEYLNWVCEHKNKSHNLIAIGGYVLEVRRSRANARKKLIAIIEYVKRKYPNIRIHTLGLADMSLIRTLREDLYSVDSTNWLSDILYRKEVNLYRFQVYQRMMYGLNRMLKLQEKYDK